ncbi:hypothetical protein PGTUg99_009002 [Puccinia graminis f. sp. tritici]|uniref:Uncharacterized protein n=1 Tax=Puccinia graminis f. sp. tritici TaxID=56615 RepID=A0A5B0PTB6_PUCGR|nr:hypothetical protein PGTUg99_009002 [Puccinia graminis f. sp. tritici]
MLNQPLRRGVQYNPPKKGGVGLHAWPGGPGGIPPGHRDLYSLDSREGFRPVLETVQVSKARRNPSQPLRLYKSQRLGGTPPSYRDLY